MASLKTATSCLMEQLVGHEEQRQNLLQNLKDEQLASAFIFHGPRGVGKKKLVRALLQVANCQKAEWACGCCSLCVRSLEEKNEFIHELNLQSKINISVDQVRDLRQQLSLKPLHSVRFVIIDSADRLSVAASNALLKLLEESPPKTYFFLITDRLGSLIATIRSRCQKISFTGLSKEELVQIHDFSARALDWSRGSVDRAFFLEEVENREQLDESLKFFRSLLCEDPQDWKRKFPWFFSKDTQREFCLGIWNQALYKKLHGEDDNLHWLPSDTNEVSFVFEQLQSFEKDLWGHVDKLLALENFYYSLRTPALAAF